MNDEIYDRLWWTPVGIMYEEELIKISCPYYIASTGGPKDVPGAFGPGTCGGGCYDEPRCMT